jgi:hypothetical protein
MRKTQLAGPIAVRPAAIRGDPISFFLRGR